MIRLSLLSTAFATLFTAAAIVIVALLPRPAGDGVTGPVVGYEVFDRTVDTVSVAHNEHKQFRAASVVKLLIALDYLETQGPGYQIPADDRTLLESMLRVSDDSAASKLWGRSGKDQIVRRMVTLIGLTDTTPPKDTALWGYTAISAADIVKIYRYILDTTEPSLREFIMSNLNNATKCAADGFDQSFGIPAAVPTSHKVKQGWSGFGSSPGPDDRCTPGNADNARWQRNLAYREHQGAATAATIDDTRYSSPTPQRSGGDPGLDLTSRAMHTTGTVGANDDQIVVVLTLEPVGTSWQESAARITELTRAVYVEAST